MWFDFIFADEVLSKIVVEFEPFLVNDGSKAFKSAVVRIKQDLHKATYNTRLVLPSSTTNKHTTFFQSNCNF